MSKFGKYFLLATGCALLATFARIPGAVINVHAHAGLCSVASLKGTYAFHRSGMNNTMGGPVAEIGLDFFNGDGTRGVIRSTGTSYPESYDWTNAPWPNGSYSVDPDCTGSLFNASGKFSNIIVLDGGKRFSLMSFEPDKVVTGEGIRLEEEKD
ncbi:MAG: hypothetical protein ACLPND_07585 [Candidatus Korobacteraceae bacterium]